MKLIRALCAAALAIVPLACSQSDHLYSNLPAYFVVDNVLQAPVLHTALQSMGEFCTIRFTGDKYEFASPTQRNPSYINATQLSSHSGFYLGMSGLVVGLPNIPEMGHDNSRPVCYDLSCPNCYAQNSTTKRMTLQTNGYTHCSACQRTYNLNDMGLVVKGEAGKPLIRYRVSYVGYTLVVNNR